MRMIFQREINKHVIMSQFYKLKKYKVIRENIIANKKRNKVNIIFLFWVMKNSLFYILIQLLHFPSKINICQQTYAIFLWILLTCS